MVIVSWSSGKRQAANGTCKTNHRPRIIPNNPLILSPGKTFTFSYHQGIGRALKQPGFS